MASHNWHNSKSIMSRLLIRRLSWCSYGNGKKTYTCNTLKSQKDAVLTSQFARWPPGERWRCPSEPSDIADCIDLPPEKQM